MSVKIAVGRPFAARLVVVLCALAACAACWSAPALAAAPVVAGESFSDVGSSSASVSAQVNAEGEPSTYFFEYGTSENCFASASCVQTPVTSLGSVAGIVQAPADLSELQPGTVYYFRVVAENEDGRQEGIGESFTTLTVGILGLPDGRVFEMVTPESNLDADVYRPDGGAALREENSYYTRLPFQAAAAGDAVAYVGSPSSNGNGSSGNGNGNEYVATRSPSGGWTQVNVTPPGLPYSTGYYQGFSSDLAAGFLTAYGDENSTLLAAGTPAGTDYDIYRYDTASGSFHALVTTTPANERLLEGYEVNTPGILSSSREGGVYAGSSSDPNTPSHALFEENNALTANAVEGADGAKENNLYDSVEGRLYLVNVLPDGRSEDNATFGAPTQLGVSGSLLESGGPDFSHVISADGSRVFWSALESITTPRNETLGLPKALYVRENDAQPQSPLGAKGECTVPADACTVQVDAAAAGAPGPGGGGRFWTASSDGSRVFFTDENRLTSDSTAASGEPDLYEYNVESGDLADLSVAGAGAHADVQGVIGAGEAGEYVYFVADGSLASGATAGQPNLYLRHAGVTTFIATLAVTDGYDMKPFRSGGGEQEHGDWQAGLSSRTAEVAPDGESVAFMSSLSLPAQGFPGGAPDGGMSEVYVYEAKGGGRLFCVSCSPSGEAPPITAQALVGGSAGYLPTSESNVHADQVISEDGGRVFFDSGEPLVAQDDNGEQDVYEWERDGEGSCAEANGCIYLLSGGTGTTASWLLDASVSGDDVFIITRTQLLPQDQNENYDVYDVRVGGVQPATSPACSGTGCQGVAGAPPIFATPASATFVGVGNFPPPAAPVAKTKTKAKSVKCKKGEVKQHGKCVRAKRNKRIKAKARKASDRRRAK